MAGTVDLDRRSILMAAFLVIGGTVLVMLLTSGTLSATAHPEIVEGDFVKDSGDGLLAASSASCSTDSDCDTTTCDGTDYLVDTDGDVSCTDYDGDGDTECTGYDESYADADYCGGRYDYNCDSSGCDGYKAACEDDCDANSGCDSYSFCGSDDDDDSSSSGSTSSCTDQCESLTKKCDGSGSIVQCQDTDSDSCTDGFVAIADCDGDCSNAQCISPEPTEPSEPDDTVTDPVDPEPDSVTARLAAKLETLWNALFGWL